MTEDQLHVQIAQYLRLRYPQILWRTDMGGVRLTPGLRAKSRSVQGGRAWPDLFIAKPVGGMSGLFIELKKEQTSIYKKSGALVANAHYQEQAVILDGLHEVGYAAVFGVGFNITKDIIDGYLKGENLYDETWIERIRASASTARRSPDTDGRNGHKPRRSQAAAGTLREAF